VRELVEAAFGHVGIALDWVGTGVDERGVERGTGRVLVEVDPKYFRPSEVDCLVGDAAKARAALGWAPKVSFHELVRIMVEHDLEGV
jgi:GDPmannose 4,6-dehydratase